MTHINSNYSLISVKIISKLIQKFMGILMYTYIMGDRGILDRGG